MILLWQWEIHFHRSCGQLTTSPFRPLSTKDDLDMLSLLPYLKQFLLEIENVCTILTESAVALPMPLLLLWNDIKHKVLQPLTTSSWPLSAPLVVWLQVITDSNSCDTNGLLTHSSTLSLPFSHVGNSYRLQSMNTDQVKLVQKFCYSHLSAPKKPTGQQIFGWTQLHQKLVKYRV